MTHTHCNDIGHCVYLIYVIMPHLFAFTLCIGVERRNALSRLHTQPHTMCDKTYKYTVCTASAAAQSYTDTLHMNNIDVKRNDLCGCILRNALLLCCCCCGCRFVSHVAGRLPFTLVHRVWHLCKMHMTTVAVFFSSNYYCFQVCSVYMSVVAIRLGYLLRLRDRRREVVSIHVNDWWRSA